MSNESRRKVTVSFEAADAEKFTQQLNALNVQYEKLQAQNEKLVTLLSRSSLALETQREAFDLIATRSKAAGAGVDFLNNAESVSAKAIAQVTALLNSQAKAQNLVNEAVKEVTTPQQRQTEQTDLAARIQEQEKYLALQKQIQETDLLTAKQRGAAEAALQAQIQETDLLRAKSAAAAQAQAQKQIEETDLLTRAQENQQFLAQQKQAVIAMAGVISEAGKSAGLQAEAAPVTNVLRDARGARDALFAFGLALNLVISELGSQLPPAAKQAASGIKIVADSLLAGAYIGGGAGAVIGGLAGVLVALGAAALSIDPAIKSLNDSLDKLAAKDDASQGLAKLAKVSNESAAAALEYVSANKSLAESFQNQVQAAQPAIPVLQGLGDNLRATQELYLGIANAIVTVVPHLRQFTDALGASLKVAQQGEAFYAALIHNLALGYAPYEAIIRATQIASQADQQLADAQAGLTKRTLELAAAQQYLAGAVARDTVQKAQDEIDKLRLEGGSADDLTSAIYKLLKAKQDLSEANATSAGKQGALPVIGQGAIEAERAAQLQTSNFLNATATKLAKDLLAVQRQYNDDSASLAEDHARRLDEIGSNAYEQQVRMERDLVRRLTEIRAQYNQDVTDAGTDYATRLADVEANAQESRDKIVQDYADRRAQIEKDYQDKIAQIQADYALSLIDIDARRDGLALLRARASRDKQLADAAKQRDKDNEAAQKAREKAQKDLDEALAKQKRQLEQEYERRLRDLAQSFEKQTASAQQNYRDQLADLTDATARQYAAENAAYARSQKALDKANAEKKQSLIDALIEIKGINDQYGQAIIDSLKRILDPATIIQLTNDLQKAFDTQIEIKVTPNASSVGSNGLPIEERTFAEGGYIANTQRALVHAGETVLPAQNAQRAYELASQHLARVSMPLSGRYMGSSNGSGGSIKLYIDNSINNALLSSQIRAESIGIAVDIVKQARS